MPAWLSSVFGMELRRILTYRTDFWVNFFGQTFFAIIIAYYLWSSVFQGLGVEQLNGFSMQKIIIYYLLVPLVFRIQQGQSIGSISREIYEGSLNKFLLYPINFFSYKVITHLANASFYIIQIAVITLVYRFFFDTEGILEINAFKVFAFICAMVLVSICYFFLNSLSELVAFWADYIWSLGVIVRFLVSFLGGALIPLSFFPEWSQALLSYTPFPYMINFPMTILLEGVSLALFGKNMLILALWTLLFYIGAKFIWKRGLHSYTGVGI